MFGWFKKQEARGLAEKKTSAEAFDKARKEWQAELIAKRQVVINFLGQFTAEERADINAYELARREAKKIDRIKTLWEGWLNQPSPEEWTQLLVTRRLALVRLAEAERRVDFLVHKKFEGQNLAFPPDTIV